MGSAKIYNPSLNANLGLRSNVGTTNAKWAVSFLRLDIAVVPARLVPPSLVSWPTARPPAHPANDLSAAPQPPPP